MKAILQLLRNGFQSSSTKTPEFKSFARKFKNAFTKELQTVNATIEVYNVGHFYVSGFIKTSTGKIVYFALPDVRNWTEGSVSFGAMLYREAKDTQDYTGGTNRYVPIHEGMAKTIDAQVYMQENKISFLIS